MNAPHTDVTEETPRAWLYRIIFGTDTVGGKRFDLALILIILASLAVVMLDSIAAVHLQYAGALHFLEWGFTLMFTAEYLTRLYCSPNPKGYVKSFYGIVDLLAVLPTYLALLLPATSFLVIIRLLRVLRIFRILKLVQYSHAYQDLTRAMIASHQKIVAFLLVVMTLITIFGSLMYVIEGPEYGFTSIPRSIYWAIVTVTTVGYGDITPHTVPGQFIAALSMLTGYAILAVPTSILSAEMFSEMQRERMVVRCNNCERSGHEKDAEFCRFCGADIDTPISDDEDWS